MRRVLLSASAGVLLALSVVPAAIAAPPEKLQVPATFISPDFDEGLVLFINMNRETFCTPEAIAFEEAFIAWFEGGQVGDPPVAPPQPEGFDLVSITEKETGKGAIVQLLKGSGLAAEIWEMDTDAQGFGPCTDTDGALHRLGTGTARLMSNDNDIFGSGTRGNAFGNRGVINFVGEDGERHRYSFKFHVNSRCHGGDFEACAVQSSRLR